MTIKDIEKKIVDLTIREKDLVEARNAERVEYLKAAEAHPTVTRIAEELFIKGLGVDRRSLSRYSQEGRCGGAGGEEFLEDVQVTVFASLDESDPRFRQCTDMNLRVRVTGGFDNEKSRERERTLTAEIMELRRQIDILKQEKRRLKQGGGPA